MGNHEKCIGCGECVPQCPARAWVRSEKRYYRLTLLGRAGKKNPRLGEARYQILTGGRLRYSSPIPEFMAQDMRDWR